jgi:hypothetical protein
MSLENYLALLLSYKTYLRQSSLVLLSWSTEREAMLIEMVTRSLNIFYS